MSSVKGNQQRAYNRCLLVLAVLLPLLVWPAATMLADSVAATANARVRAEHAMLPVDQPQGTLVRAITSEPNSLDLPQTTETQAFTTAWQMYDSLVWADADGKVAPALAQSWEVSQDGTQYTFGLRQDVTFHNGEPFDADAVVFSWERARSGGFVGSAHWQRATSVEKTGEYTVTITTAEADGLFLRTVADHWAMIPPVYFQAVGQAGFDAHPIGTGPFEFVEWEAGDHITMQAYPDYWREGLPKIETVVFRPIPDSADRVTAIQGGSVDIVTRLSLEEAQTLAGADGIEVVMYPVDRVYYIAFNNLTTGVGEPTEDARVRKAMNYAVDVRSMIDTYFGGFARESTGFVTPANLGYDDVKPFGHDPSRASSLLTEAGYAGGFQMDMACPTGAYSHFEEICTDIADDLGDVGIDVNLEFMESGEFWDLEANKQLPPLFGDSWSSSVGEAYHRLYGALAGWDAAYSAWSDPEIDQLLDNISTETDQEERAALYGRLQVYMRDNPPFVYLYERFAFEAINSQVEGYVPRANEHYFLMHAWLDGDGDGVVESVEDQAPNGGDGNADGVLDRDQENVASLPNAVDERYLTVESPAGSQLSGVQTLESPSPGDAPITASFPFGFVDFDVVGIQPGSSVSVTLYLPLEPDLGTYWRYGPTEDDPSQHWYRFDFDGTTGAEILHELDQTRITLHYVDGARGDGDLVANGQIVDPGAPGIPSPTIYLPLILHNQ
jgi:peptide/nickel transport system substrate-binding protein